MRLQYLWCIGLQGRLGPIACIAGLRFRENGSDNRKKVDRVIKIDGMRFHIGVEECFSTAAAQRAAGRPSAGRVSLGSGAPERLPARCAAGVGVLLVRSSIRS